MLRSFALRCDACGQVAPDVVAPILEGIYGWGSFEIVGEHEGRAYRAAVLACPRCKHGVAIGTAPIASLRGGQAAEPEWIEKAEATAPSRTERSA